MFNGSNLRSKVTAFWNIKRTVPTIVQSDETLAIYSRRIHTVKPLIKNTSEEFIKCRLDNFSMDFILF